jgi:hypothetical protein
MEHLRHLIKKLKGKPHRTSKIYRPNLKKQEYSTKSTC